MGNDDRTFGEKISDSVAKFGGSWWFIILGVFLIFVWQLTFYQFLGLSNGTDIHLFF